MKTVGTQSKVDRCKGPPAVSGGVGRLLARFSIAVAGRDLEPGDEHDVHDLIIAVRLVNKHLPSRGSERHKILMLDGQPPAIREMNDERMKGLPVKKFANVVHFHGDILKLTARFIKALLRWERVVKRSMLSLCLTLIFFGLALPLAAQTVNTNAATVSAGVVRGFPGRTVNVPFFLGHTGGISGAQFDFSYPADKLTAGLFQAASLSNNTVLRWRQVSPGVHRVLAYTKDLAVLKTNTSLGSLPFSVPANDFSGGGRITISNAIVARTNAVAASPIRLIHGGVLVELVFRGEDGVVDLYLTVASNKTYVIQATSDFTNWVNIATNFTSLDYVVATDLEAGAFAMRFYRAVPWTDSGGERQISGVRLESGGIFTFVYPSTPGQMYVFQVSTNLTAWENLVTNSAMTNFLGFTNLISPAYPQRFFRVQELP